MNWKNEVFDLISGESIDNVDPSSARELIIKNLPEKIYKYRSVNNFSKENLDTFTVWMESPENLNDPFDSAHTLDAKKAISLITKKSFGVDEKYNKIPGLVTEENIKVVKESDDPIKLIVEKATDRNSSLPPTERSKFVDVFLGAIQNELDRFTRWSNETLRDGCKLCSFSETNTEMLLWSHYAKDHSGFCIEWDLTDFPEKHNLGNLIYPVIYSDKLFDTTKHLNAIIRGRQPNPLLATAAGMKKSTIWSYEKEWRFFFPIGPGTDSYNFQMPKPSKVFLGAYMKDDEKKEIVEICKKHEILIEQMKISIKDYSLEAEEYVDV